MASAIWSRVIRGVLFLWLALTFWLVWHRIGVYRPWLHHAYFARWMMCGIFTDTPLLKRAALYFPFTQQATQLNGLYGDTFYHWCWHMAAGTGGYYGIGTWLLPVGLVVAALAWRLNNNPDSPDHIRGLKLLPPRQSRRALTGDGLLLGDIHIPHSRETEHFLITGSPGAGKSTLIRQMLNQIAERGQIAIVLDVEGEFTQEFYNAKRGDLILNPLDARCPYWTPWSEIVTPMDRDAIASSLIRTLPSTATERFFFDSGRTLIKCLLEVIATHEPNAIADFLAQDPQNIHNALRGTAAYRLVDPDMRETGHNIVATAVNAVNPFQYLPSATAAIGQWSAREYAEHPEGWLFLPSTATSQSAVQPLQGVWLDCLVRRLMDAEIGSETIWIIADELPALDYQPNILTLITRGRKRGRSVVMGFQNVSQLRSIYKPDGAVTLTSAPTTKIILRCDHYETAEWSSDQIGSHEVERLQMTQLAGLSNFREGVNLSPHRSIERLVLPAEIQALQPLHGYLCIAGEDRTTIDIPKLRLKKHCEAFIPR